MRRLVPTLPIGRIGQIDRLAPRTLEDGVDPLQAAEDRGTPNSRISIVEAFWMATMAAIAAPSVSTIWFGPDEESEPNSLTDRKSIRTSETTGINASISVGSFGRFMCGRALLLFWFNDKEHRR